MFTTPLSDASVPPNFASPTSSLGGQESGVSALTFSGRRGSNLSALPRPAQVESGGPNEIQPACSPGSTVSASKFNRRFGGPFFPVHGFNDLSSQERCRVGANFFKYLVICLT
ncbi:unnamed protein product [Protopolystoma xenopodis]|uniref:Uncharacterized protein n=1 Tax=Protopolystoma xenopodis TaxID=117903 RepID=A0A448XNQ8_9PLAT|nr:unnamed protein product [Protopolystoma xenopodis]